MTAATCQLCAAQVADLANLCTRCTRTLAENLAAIPELDADLDVTVFKQARIGAGGGGARSSEPKMPANLDADSRGRHLKQVLTSWAHLIADQRGIPRPLDGVATASRWMRDHLEWLRHHPAAGDAATEICEAVRQVRRAIDLPQERVYAGPCSSCHTALYAKPGAAQVECRQCATPELQLTYDVTERRTWMLDSVADLHMPPPQAAHTLTALIGPIKAELIRTWNARGKLTPASYDDHGHPLYRLWDIAQLMHPAARKAG